MRGHVLFAALFLLVVATQAARFTADASTEDAPDLSTCLASLGLKPAGERPDGTVLATAPGCNGPIGITQLEFDGLGTAAGRALLAKGGETRAIYLGLVSPGDSVPSMLGRWAVASLRRTIGLRRTPVPRYFVFVAWPKTCPALAQLDWTVLSPWQ